MLLWYGTLLGELLLPRRLHAWLGIEHTGMEDMGVQQPREQGAGVGAQRPRELGGEALAARAGSGAGARRRRAGSAGAAR